MTKKHRNDLILLAALLLAGIVTLTVVCALQNASGKTVVVTVDGEEISRLPLKEDTELLIDGYDGGYNLLVIKDGTAEITEADCPEQICVKTGAASEIKSIVCAHHRVVVSIEK